MGAGDGSAALLAAREYGLAPVRAYDVNPPTTQGPLPVRIFDGRRLDAESNESWSIVMFGYVLHHAGADAPALLDEASRIARQWVLVLEDLDVPLWRKRNWRHDDRGVFRTDGEWRALLMRAGLRVVASGPVFDHTMPQTYYIARSRQKRAETYQPSDWTQRPAGAAPSFLPTHPGDGRVPATRAAMEWYARRQRRDSESRQFISAEAVRLAAARGSASGTRRRLPESTNASSRSTWRSF